MGAERDRGDTDRGEGRGGDRPDAILHQAERASRHRAGGQGRDNPVGEGSVKTEVIEVCLRCSRTLPMDTLCWGGREHEPATLTTYWGVAEIDISFPAPAIKETAHNLA